LNTLLSRVAAGVDTTQAVAVERVVSVLELAYLLPLGLITPSQLAAAALALVQPPAQAAASQYLARLLPQAAVVVELMPLRPAQVAG
jgi:hypothetical protein